MILEDHQVLVAQVFRNHMQFPFRLHILKLPHVLKRKGQFEIIHDVKDDDVIAFRSEHFQTREDVFRLVIEIGNQYDDSASSEIFGQKTKRFSEFRQLAGLDSIDLRQNRQQLAAAPSRRHMGPDLRIEGQETYAIPLVIREVAETCGDDSGVIDLFDVARAVIHGSADVEKDEDACIRLTFIQLYIELVAARKDVPIDSPDLITRHVLAVCGEIHAEAQVRGTVKTLNKTCNDAPRDEFEVLNFHQNLGIDEAVFRLFDDRCAHRANLSIPTLEAARHRATA